MPPAAAPATTSAQALGNLQSFQGSMKSGGDILNQQEQSLGVPQAQQQVSGLRQAITNTTNLLNQVAPSVYGRTQNSLVTTAQAGNQIANEQAPLNTQLNKENTDYGNAATDYKDLLDKAGTLASLQVQDQATKLANFKDIYDALYGQEKDAAAAQLEQQKLAETAREANLSAKSSGSGGLGAALGSLFGGGGSPAASTGPSMSAKPGGGGFNFTNAGRPISAATYSQITGTPLGTVLASMAKAGDTYAANAYRSLQLAKTPQAQANVRKNYSALFWGT